ncbi:hypothetical protein PPSIR1_15055 [Plesiocystis pacifica SIR-1]|uniref:PilZ domain-containing protein n=1 Tax=Plesiocystis pacifica SIR-1 TaxID=391625 RepID=A6G6D8_9BACT|nr:PilZ domain-containing protein [Plesiocystis pacifica]EDM78567.1 hypothetical protein PPSIR1_15055 [Plesiocystis pacifica SIR-1]
MSNEARVHPRLRLAAFADVIGDEVVLHRALGDISVGGCRFEGPAWERVGTKVQLLLSFPVAEANMPVDGTVVRASKRDMGVRFDATDEQKWALRKHIRRAQGG